MRNRVLASVLIVILVFGLVACGNNELAGSSTNENVDETADVEAVVDIEETEDAVSDEAIVESSGELSGEFKEFTALDIYGNEVNEEIIKGYDLVMINIWATFCPPCLDEMPDLGELAVEYADENVLILGLCADIYDETYLSTAVEIVDETGADYTHLQPSQDLIDIYLYQVSAVPETIFLDPTGTIIGSEIGSRSKESWQEVIDGYLDAK